MAGLAARKNVISKSQYLKGLQCQKALWLYRHRKELATPFDKETEQRLAAGHNIGELAKQYFWQRGPAVEVHAQFWNVEEGVRQTRSFLAEGEDVIFEATAVAESEQAYSRIDVLRRKLYGQIELIEVKSASKVKDYHIEDMAFQYHVFQTAGYSVATCYMMLIDTSYVRQGELELEKLFQLCDITNAVLARQRKVQESCNQFTQMLETLAEPQQRMDSHCHRPFSCEYMEYCQSLLQCLPNELFAAELPSEAKIKVEAQTSTFNSPITQVSPQKSYQIRPAQLQSWLSNLQYPLYFLDYECFQSALPLFNQSRPYQVIPFQFSLHIQRQAGAADLEHFSFLHMQRSDPREAFIQALLRYCNAGETTNTENTEGENIAGSIVVYNQAFEASINRSLGRDFPAQRQALKALNKRMVDIYLPFQKRWLYSPHQRESTSLKAVLPAFTPFSYDNMTIDNGLEAMTAYLAFMLGACDAEQAEQLKTDLEQYCHLDTRAMSLLLDAIYRELELHPPKAVAAQSSPDIVDTTLSSANNGQSLDILH